MAEAARRSDRLEFIEVEFGDGLVPALCSGAPVGRLR